MFDYLECPEPWEFLQKFEYLSDADQIIALAGYESGRWKLWEVHHARYLRDDGGGLSMIDIGGTA